MTTHQRNRRIFDPFIYGTEMKINEDLFILNPASEPKSIVIFINSFSSDNKIAGSGVYFADGSHHNISVSVPDELPQTKNMGLLHAINTLLMMITEMYNKPSGYQKPFIDPSKPGEMMNNIIIATDSDYVMSRLCDRVWKWEKEGYINMKGGPVEHKELFHRIHEGIEGLQSRGIEINFWFVEGEAGTFEAEQLAREVVED